VENARAELRHIASYSLRAGIWTAGCGSGSHGFLRGGSDRVRFRCTLLRRARLDDSGVRLRIHVLVRNARRDHRVGHWLGPNSRIRGREHGRGSRLVRVFRAIVWKPVPSEISALVGKRLPNR
jgi:hypothetical protein